MVDKVNTLKRISKILTKFVLDVLFPVECLGCGKDDVWLCEDCFQKIPLTGDFINLGSDNFLSGVWAASYYQNNEILQELIKDFKYKFITDLVKPLSNLVIKSLTDNQLAGQFINGVEFLVIPVPLHRRRYLERGFNQSELLARDISQHFGWRLLTNILKRRRYTTPQVSLTGQHRRDNLRGAFTCLSPGVIQGKKIILIDDIFTTGSTLNECAKVLKQAAARQVWGLVIAKDQAVQ